MAGRCVRQPRFTAVLDAARNVKQQREKSDNGRVRSRAGVEYSKWQVKVRDGRQIMRYCCIFPGLRLVI
jgi:hypothetical protein